MKVGSWKEAIYHPKVKKMQRRTWEVIECLNGSIKVCEDHDQRTISET